MTLDELYQGMYDYCRWNNGKKLQDLLDKFGQENTYNEMDLFHLDGLFWEIAVAHEVPNVLNILLEYYKKTQLALELNSLEYKVAKHKLLCTLAKAADSYCASAETQKVLDQYISSSKNNDSDSRQDLSEIEEEHTSSHDDEGSYESSKNSNLTAENLHRLEVVISGDMTAEHEIQSGT